MRPFNTIDVNDTIGMWVDAFNKNALASSDHTWYLGEMLYNGILYTGLETIGGQPIKSLTNTNISAMSAQNLELDNFYLYFRDINKVLLVDQVTFDLRPYNTNHPMFFYINSELGFRVSQKFEELPNEVMLFRFILGTNEVFKQCYVTAQRFGSNVYDTADEFYYVKGCVPLPAGGLQIKLGDGTIKRSGIRFDFHQVPDLITIKDKGIPFNLRYITKENKVDFDAAVTRDVNPNKMMNYSTGVISNVPSDKFTVQRMLYDVYTDCLILQYGNGAYNSIQEALSSVNNVGYPFPYNELMFIPLGLIAIKQGCIDLSDPNQCIMVQQLNTTVDATQSVFFAEDSYARGRLVVMKNEIDKLDQKITDVNNRLTNEVNRLDKRIDDANTYITKVEGNLNNHIKDYNNPHKVTKAQVGLGNVDNKSFASIQSDFDGRYVKISGDETVHNRKTFDGYVVCNNYITIQGRKLYLGGSPSGQSTGDFWLPDN